VSRHHCSKPDRRSHRDNLELDGSTLKKGNDKKALYGMEVKGSVYFRSGFSGDGVVSLAGARIGLALEVLAWESPEKANVYLTDTNAGFLWNRRTAGHHPSVWTG
jgi:hypothetical protein